MIGMQRLMGLMVMSGVGATQSQTMMDMADGSLDVVRVAVTQYELAQMRTAVVTEVLFGGPQKVTKDFSEFIKGNMSASGRDPSIDFWETPYWAEQFEDGGDRGIDLCSNGPDKQRDTDDDICVEVLLK